MWPLLLLTVVIILLSYILRKTALVLSFWRKSGVKFIGFWEALKDNYRLFAQPISHQTIHNYKKYGKVFGTYTAFESCIWIGDPDLLRGLFIKNFSAFADRFKTQKVNHAIWDKMILNLTGEEWRYVRSTMTPSLSSGKLKLMVNTVVKIADHTVEHVVEAAKEGKLVDVKEVFGAFSLDVIGRMAFTVNLDSQKDVNNPFVIHAKHAFALNGARRIFYAQLFPWLFKLFSQPLIPEYIIDFYTEFSRTIIEKRKTEDFQNAADFLQLLLNTEEKLRKEQKAGQESLSEKNKILQKVFDLDSVVAQSVLFFLAAYDSIAVALTFAAYELGINEDVQEKLIQEIDEHIRTDEDITYENISGMPYLEAVINENLRKNTVVPRLFRVCTEDVDMEGYHIKKGTQVHIPAHAIHHDPVYYPEPEVFNPDRFLPKNKTKLVPFTFLAFGEGPRHCISMRLAMMEMKVILIKLLKRVQFKRSPETLVPLPLRRESFNLDPAKDVMLKVVQRVP